MRTLILSAGAGFFAVAAHAQTVPQTDTRAETAPSVWSGWVSGQPHWVAPFEPFRVIGNLYYVGTEGIAVYLIAGDKGHVLIDGAMPGYEQIIVDNIATLGFDIKDVKTLLNTHAHFDHSGGLAVLKEISGAQFYASEGDVPALETGTYPGFEDRPAFSAPPPVSVDHVIDDRSQGGYEGWKLTVGNVSLSPELTPGHSRGCTSWRMSADEGGQTFDVLIFCSASVAANRLVPEQYEGIVDDYRLTFEKTKDWETDIFLSNHAEVFDLKETREIQKSGDPLAFVNRSAFQLYRARLEEAFEKALAAQQKEAGQSPANADK